MLRLQQDDEEIEKAGPYTVHVHSMTEHLSYMAKPPALHERSTFIILSDMCETQVSMSVSCSVGSGGVKGPHVMAFSSC